MDLAVKLLRQSEDAKLVIGSPHVGLISPKFGFFSKMEKYPPLDINLNSIPNTHHTRVNMSSHFESCLLSNRNTAVMLPYDKCWLKAKYMQNLVIGSPHVGFISPKFGKFSKMYLSSRLCDEFVSGISVTYLDIFPIWKIATMAYLLSLYLLSW